MPEATLDPRKVMTGHDGKLYITVDGKSQFMANVDTFQSQLNFSNTDFQPVGDLMQYAIPIGVSCNLSFTEAVISDSLIMGPILDGLREGKVITFSVRAFDEAGEIGNGTHKRVIINSQKFLEKAYGKL